MYALQALQPTVQIECKVAHQSQKDVLIVPRRTCLATACVGFLLDGVLRQFSFFLLTDTSGSKREGFFSGGGGGC